MTAAKCWKDWMINPRWVTGIASTTKRRIKNRGRRIIVTKVCSSETLLVGFDSRDSSGIAILCSTCHGYLCLLPKSWLLITPEHPNIFGEVTTLNLVSYWPSKYGM